MKILSKYKDYYDYLQGIYGTDPKIVLDRRKNKVLKKEDLFSSRWDNSELGFIAIAINDKLYTGVYSKSDDKFYYGEDLEKFKEKYDAVAFASWYLRESNFLLNPKSSAICLFDRTTDGAVLILNKQPVSCEINSKFNCPIVLYNSMYSLKRGEQPKFYPMLKEFEFHKALSAPEVYREISDWISRKITEKESRGENTLSNDEKIDSKGFDKKRSFRPNMKK